MLLVLLATTATAQDFPIIPQPAHVQPQPGNFTITPTTRLVVTDAEDRKAAVFLNNYLQECYGIKLAMASQATKDFVRLSSRSTTSETEGYKLQVATQGVTITGNSPVGTFYGMQTLLQLLPVQQQTSLTIPAVLIEDAPRFPYRGMHLDVARHIFPVPFLKKYLDYLALHKMNYFHWHLTDDQGWRIEIKKYPNLTSVGAYRAGTIRGRYPGTGNDNTRYGGYYTQAEVKEIVAYAADRHITVIPEIEMPGHSSAALAAYPWLGCPGTGPYKVQETWGIFPDIYCAGSDSTFTFLQDVLTEVLALFPSKYIHIGGDEAPKANWRKCPRCQKRIKEEGLKNESELQSYFIHRIEKFLNSKGRTIIGWDEILEGGLTPNAVVMSWRGERGGIAAARQQHPVIMTPSSHLYFDHTQRKREDSVTMGGYTPLEKVYNYNPVPKVLSAEEAKYILGAQGNVWTEYIQHPEKVEYMIFPRMSALSEVLWAAPANKNFDDFEKRLLTQLQRYRFWDAGYSTAHFDLTADVAPAPGKNGLRVTFGAKAPGSTITYSLAGEKATQPYTAPLLVQESQQVTAYHHQHNKLKDSITLDLKLNKATGKPITIKGYISEFYAADGPFTLVNGLVNKTGNRTREALGFKSVDPQVTIDLGTAQEINTVTVHTLFDSDSWAYPPRLVEVHGSADGKSYKMIGSTTPAGPFTGKKVPVNVRIPAAKARYVKVVIKQQPRIAEGKPGAGETPWLFVDEVQVE